MVIDCIPFFDELDLLEVRLNELNNIVDVFLITEATLTFSGHPKALCFMENKERFSAFGSKIRHVVIDKYDSVDTTDAWAMDRWQKVQGLGGCGLQKGDIVIYSDCDEIPKAVKVREFIESDYPIATMEMPLYYYWMNCLCTGLRWKLPKFIRMVSSVDFKSVRKNRCKNSIRDAGWHFSYLGDIAKKIGAYAHKEYDKPPFNTEEYIREKKASGEDLFNRGKYRFEFKKDISYLPEYVLGNMDYFGRYIKPLESQ